MTRSIALRRFVGALFAAGLILALPTGPALSQTPEEVIVRVDRSVTFPLPRQPLTLASEDPSVAVVEVLPDGKARVTGISVGSTRIVGRDHAQVPIIIAVRVLAP